MKIATFAALAAALVVAGAAPAAAQTPPEPLPPLPAPAPSEPAPVPSAEPAPPPPPPPAALPTRDAGRVEPPPASAQTSFRATGGVTYAQLRGVPIVGGRLRGGIGTQRASAAHYVTLSLLYGSTENDLRAWDVRVGWLGDSVRVGILRFGADAELGYLTVHRASFDGRLWALGASAGVHASADLVPMGERDEHAVLLEARFDASIHFWGAVMWSPSVLVGFRY